MLGVVEPEADSERGLGIGVEREDTVKGLDFRGGVALCVAHLSEVEEAARIIGMLIGEPS